MASASNHAVEIQVAKNLEEARIGGSVFAEAFENDEYWQWVGERLLRVGNVYSTNGWTSRSIRLSVALWTRR